MNCNQPLSAGANSASPSSLDPESPPVAGLLPVLAGGAPARRHHNPPLSGYRLPAETSLSRVGGRVDGKEEEDMEEDDDDEEDGHSQRLAEQLTMEEEFDFDQVFSNRFFFWGGGRTYAC